MLLRWCRRRRRWNSTRSTIRSARLALGGVAHKPWRSEKAEALLAGKPASQASYQAAAEQILAGPRRTSTTLQNCPGERNHRARVYPGAARGEQGMTVIGEPITRVDGRAKVTGAAKYAAEFEIPQLAYAVMVTSTIRQRTHPAAWIPAPALRAPGVLDGDDAGECAEACRWRQGSGASAGRSRALAAAGRPGHYNNQPIAVVVAETLDQASMRHRWSRCAIRTSRRKLDFQGGFATCASRRPWEGSFRGLRRADQPQV